MNNKLLNEELLNIKLYDNITNKLQNLPKEKKTQAGIREELTKDVASNSSVMSNMTATIAAYYYYSLGKRELSFLTDYYHKTFSAYFNRNVIEKYYNVIIRDDFLIKLIYDICDKNVLSELKKYSEIASNYEKNTVKKKNYGLTKMKQLRKDEYNKLVLNAYLAKMIESVRQGKYNASFSDKVATIPKVLVEKMIYNISRYNGRFKSVSSLEQSKIVGIKDSFLQIFFNEKKSYKGNNKLNVISTVTINGKKIIALSGTKVSTFKGNFKQKIA